jgi:hypothetical protein
MNVRKAVRVALLVLAWAQMAPAHAIAGGVYSRLETSFTLAGFQNDPFDYTLSDIRVQVLQPDGSTVSLLAFFDGTQTWRARHTPSSPGVYRVLGATLNGQALAVGNLQPTTWTVSGFATHPGFVLLDPGNTNRFRTTDGSRFFPLGHNAAWDISAKTNVAGILAKMGAARENWSRVWMDHWDGKNLDWPAAGALGTLNLAVARKWDAIVDAAQQAGVCFQMTLHHHGQYSSAVDPNWGQNPYNVANGGFLADATQFFTNTTAKALTKRKLRYAVARWGYSPAIMAWELFNEVQFTDASRNGQWTNVAAWHDEMAQFIRLQDSYHHLVTTSSQLDQQIWGSCDYYQHHDYPTDLISALRDAPGITAGQPVKPIFGGECGRAAIPTLGVHASLWAGLMSGQSGAAQQWYWDDVDAENAYPLFRSAQEFVRMSGLADQDSLIKSAPRVTCPINGALVFAPGGGWAAAAQTSFTVGDAAPDGIGALPSFLQGNYHRSQMNMPNGYTFQVNYPQTGSFSVQVLQIAASGASLVITVDNVNAKIVNWPVLGTDITTNYLAAVPIAPGTHTIRLTNPGQDWINLGNLSLDPYTSILGAYQIGNDRFAALWLWHRTNIYNLTAANATTGTFGLAGLEPGDYSGTWWDTLTGRTLTNFPFAVTSTNPASIASPLTLRSAAFFAGVPPRAGVLSGALTRTLSSNSPPLIVPISLTNSGGLPLRYSLSVTGATPVLYRAVDSTESGGPQFSWTDISSVGRELTGDLVVLTSKPALDEGIAGPVDIGFPFPFFSGTQSPDFFNQIYVSPNGFVTFAPFGGDSSAHGSLPSAILPGNSIAPFWADLDLSISGHIYCLSDPLDGTCTLQFQDVSIKGTTQTITFQVVLKTSGEILFQYQNAGSGNRCTVGIQDGARTGVLQVAFDQPYLQNGLAIRVTPTPWLSLAQNAGMVSGNQARNLELALDPTGLAPATYSATLRLNTSDPQSVSTSFAISLTLLSPVQQWRVEHFGNSTNSGDGADWGDPDGDGIPNFVEYALGLDPNVQQTAPVVVVVAAGRLTLSYRRPHPAPTDVTYIAEVSPTLSTVDWKSGPSYTAETVAENGDGTETVTVTDLAPLSSAPAHYVRVRFSP